MSIVMTVRLTFTEPVLGTLAGNPAIADDFIRSKHPSGEPSKDEQEAHPDPAEVGVSEEILKASTVFPRDDGGNPIFWDYQIKGFFKDACSMLHRVDGDSNQGLKAHKKIIDGLIFPQPRKIAIHLLSQFAANEPLPFTQRPLRASTPQGERVSLVRSETVPAGSWVEFDILLLEPSYREYVCSWLDYGRLRGLGQWRNSGMGRFTWKDVSKDKT